MNKRIKFLISVSLIFAIFVSIFILPASSYTNDVYTTSGKMILVNIDTNTAVYSKDADTKWYLGYLSELMTFIVAYESIKDLDKTKFKVDQSYASTLPQSDGCLNPYIGYELTAKDLLGIMVICSGNDAAYALADLSTGGDRDAFVQLMNKKAEAYAMKDTSFASPGYNTTSSHVTTCRDLYRLYLRLRKIDLYQEFMDMRSYIPEGLYVEGDESHNMAYTVYSEASIINEISPYYFKYVDTAKLSVTDATKAGIALTSLYRGHNYFFAALDGLYESEKNVYGDARKLLTWAFLNLSDHRLLTDNQKVGDVDAITAWGNYQVSLYPQYSVVKTLPNNYSEEKISFTEEVVDHVNTPLRKGEEAGSVIIEYEGESIGSVPVSTKTDEGLGMLSDNGHYFSYVFGHLMPNKPEKTPESTEPEPTVEATLPEHPTQPVNKFGTSEG